MLRSAHLRKKDGVDVKIGYVDTHGRKGTEALLKGLSIIPYKKYEYRGIKIDEMDLDAILSIKPQLVLVDELAHTNTPGSRHTKRYQDVEELLEAGIDVDTTLNVQHLESLKDIVAQITGVQVRETIPDQVIDNADEIVVVDITPAELLKRLKEGKVYIPEMAAKAIERFFNEGNLYGLRELTLRKTAERVDNQMLAYMQTHAIPGPWASTETLLACVGPSPLSERLIRTARRQADQIGANWHALYVEIPSHQHLSKSSKEQINKTLQLAEKLGATTTTVFGTNIASTVLDYAKNHNVTRILLGKTLRSRWQELVFGSVVDQIIHDSGLIDVYMITSKEKTSRKQKWEGPLLPDSLPKDYFISIAMIIVVTIFGLLIKSFISSTNILMLYLVLVVLISWKKGLKPAIFNAFVGVLAFDVFFITPYLSLKVSDTEYIITFIGMIVIGSLVSFLVARTKEHAESAQIREKETNALFAFSRDLAVAIDANAILITGARHIQELFQGENVFLLSVSNNQLLQISGNLETNLDEDEMAVALWSYKNRAIAGKGTDTLPGSKFRFIPLQTSSGIFGIMGVKPKKSDYTITSEQSRILMAFANLIALALERVYLGAQ